VKGPHGNGVSGLEIGQADLGGWFRQRPHLHLRCVVPITRDGATTELHAWYDVHLLPPSPLGPAPKQEKTV